ncbi:MAG: hypothetical protein F6K19_32150 [Cyanothece sp. SIO1E1]|nr:hypothetical protein [Cyanothece sp. SIO1E1]
MSRDALVVGINAYGQLANLRSPAQDAEAIAQLLTQQGEFRVWRLPEVVQDSTLQVGRQTPISLNQLEDALVQLFKPTGQHIPDTALFFFSGHGLRKDRGIQEGYLATSDVNPAQGNWGLSLQWLRRLLQESPVPHQIVWLDCCYSGELLNFTEADPGIQGERKSLFLIAASREFEPAYEQIGGQHSVLTAALLKGLDPRRQPTGVVTNDTLIGEIEQTLQGETQQPLWLNPSHEILLTGTPGAGLTPDLMGTCPYKGLRYFDVADAPYFYGRADLTDQLLDQVKVGQGNFLAVLGASGSGKSSVVRAGLIHQLQQGHRLSGSDQWQIRILTPGEHPLNSLAMAFLDPTTTDIDRAEQLQKATRAIAEGAPGLARLIQVSQAPRTMLVIDQFEELFTLCQDLPERQRFLACLLGAFVNRRQNPGDRIQESGAEAASSLISDPALAKLCVVLVMRADFLGKCTEQVYSGLADQIQAHLVTVKPMTAAELEEAIRAPARQVGLRVDDNLVTQILSDLSLEESRLSAEPGVLAPSWEPGSLPLLAYTLEQLWRYRTLDRLTLDSYIRLGGVRKALENRADEVYKALPPIEQQAAKRIFLELTQLGEGTEDTRRRVFQQNLVSPHQPATVVDQVIQKLAAERLVVTSELLAKGPKPDRVVVVDIAHEALIRHWRRLRQWVSGNREASCRRPKRKELSLSKLFLQWKNSS